MGLYTVLYKIVDHKLYQDQEIDNDRIFNIEKFPKSSISNEFIFKNKETYYDMEETICREGYDPTMLLSNGGVVGIDDMELNFYNLGHELVLALEFLQKNSLYYDNFEDFKKSISYREFKEKYFNLIEKYNWVENYKIGNRFSLSSACDFVGDKVNVSINNLIVKIREYDAIMVEEIGFMKKGNNDSFDDSILDTPIFDRSLILEHFSKYFDNNEEYKNNILDKFVEGETFLIYM